MGPARKKQKLSNGSIAATAAEEQENGAHKDAPGKAEQQRRSLFVRGLPATATTEFLTELFSDSYPVKHATAVIDPATKQCRGYGFVTFADAEDAAGAKNEFSGHEIEGKKLRIEIAEPRHREGEDGAGGKVAEEQATQKKAQDLPQPSRLIVRNLPWTIKTSEQLSKLFLSYGKIKQAYIPKKGHGLSAGFGFVVLRGRKNAEKALEGVNGKEVDGRTLAVDWAVSKDVYEDLLNKDGEGEEADAGAEKEEAVDGEDREMSDGEKNSDEEWDTSEDEDEDEDEDDVDVQVDGEPEGAERTDERASTLFVRNLPFTCEDEDLEDHFSQFGNTRYARVVMDAGTGRSKGTGFVCFYRKEDADDCLRAAPKRQANSTAEDQKQAPRMQNSILQNEEADPSGRYTLDGRVLQVSRAVDKTEANRLTEEGAAHRYKRNEDKRKLYLLSEGTIPSNSKIWESLPPSERTMREASAKQRKTLIESNPSLHLSLTRLSVRNIPRSIGSTELKALAREAVVGFAKDVKAGSRTKLSKEELARGGDAMQDAEHGRKKAGKGVVKQAKVVFEGASGSKVREDSGAGRSRGYGFIEYYTHRNALMGLRWLNGHAIGYQVKDPEKAGKGGKGGLSKEEVQDRKKRLIVEFAIENAQVVMRRRDREDKARERGGGGGGGKDGTEADDAGEEGVAEGAGSKKRKRDAESGPPSGKKGRKDQKGGKGKQAAGPRSKPGKVVEEKAKKKVDEKLAKRNQIIGRKRAARKAKRGGGGK